MTPDVHPLLLRQLKKLGLADPGSTPTTDQWSRIVDRVSRTYQENDNDRYTMERSLSLSSEEMEGLHAQLRRKNSILHQILTRYVAEEVAAEIIQNPERLKLGGETRLVTVLFADIRNYTGFSASKDARVIVEVLNSVFQAIVPAVFEERGTLDKFLGDAVMAFFGAPNAGTDDALRAVRSAVKMMRGIARLREEKPEYKDLQIGAGILTGYAVVGNVGTERLMNYTVIGDTANSAKRLQENAKGGQVLICSATYEAVMDQVEAEPLMLEVKGKKAPMLTYHVTGMKDV
jgi:adenylate cyclase